MSKKTKKAYNRLATSDEVLKVSSQPYEVVAKILDEAHVIHDNATLLAVVKGVAYPIIELAEHH